jgi:hypothetical protein
MDGSDSFVDSGLVAGFADEAGVAGATVLLGVAAGIEVLDVPVPGLVLSGRVG